MEIDITKGPSFQVPEGAYRAILREVAELNGKSTGCAKQLRFKWEILDPQWDYRAGKNYCLDSNNGLSEDLENWLGSELETLKSPNGKLDPEKLIGREADVLIAHIHNESHNKPYVYMKAIYPPGTFIKN